MRQNLGRAPPHLFPLLRALKRNSWNEEVGEWRESRIERDVMEKEAKKAHNKRQVKLKEYRNQK